MMTELALDPGKLGLSPGVFAPKDFKAIRDLIHRETGIVLADHKATLVYSRLAPRLRATGCPTFAEYCHRIETDGDERYAAICALTTNHTHFFREMNHFDHVREHLRDQLIGSAKRGERVRVWSSASSTGEEVYSLLMTLVGTDRGLARDLAKRDFLALATDIDKPVIERATAARYAANVLSSIPDEYAQCWTKSDGATFTITEDLRGLVRFRQLNLIGEWPKMAGFNLIFCRNVMIYFDRATKETLTERLAHALLPGGTLCIGHSERISGPALALLDQIGPTIYRRKASL
jgi:chemotaxis protein methyltransferase CheR